MKYYDGTFLFSSVSYIYIYIYIYIYAAYESHEDIGVTKLVTLGCGEAKSTMGTRNFNDEVLKLERWGRFF